MNFGAMADVSAKARSASPMGARRLAIAPYACRGISYSYDGALPLSETWSGVVTRAYNADFNYSGARGHVLTSFILFRWTAPARCKWLAKTAPTVQSYGYDAVDRLTQHVDATGLLSDYQYDTNGNRTQLTQGSIATAYHLSITSNRLNSQSGAVTKSYTYDAAGNLISNGTHAYTYNARGRLAKVTYGTRSNTYALNGLGQRIRKTGYGVSTGTNRYVYDAQGHLLGDYTSTGVAIQETVYLGDIPVAVLQGTAVYHLHADHLDTPRVITDSTNKVIWRWDSDPFGATAANEDPDGDRKKFTYNLRFPGQYFDKETGLHYNYFRDYDPKIGRYVQSDPIGLAGGVNLYQYAKSNPLIYTDPTGESPIDCAKTFIRCKKCVDEGKECQQKHSDPIACLDRGEKLGLSVFGHIAQQCALKSPACVNCAVDIIKCGFQPLPLPK